MKIETKHPVKHLQIDQVTWQQVINTTEVRKSTSERLSVAELKMGKGNITSATI